MATAGVEQHRDGILNSWVAIESAAKCWRRRRFRLPGEPLTAGGSGIPKKFGCA